MSKEQKQLKDILKSSIEKYKKLELLEDDKVRGLKILSQEIKICNEKDKNEAEINILNKRFKLDELKFQEQCKLDERKLEIEKSKIKIEERKLLLEIKKYDLEQEYKIKENADAKKDRLINIGIKILEIGLPLTINTLLVLMNFKLIYVDDGRVPSELKDLMKSVYKRW